uniref:Disease resistance protein At4g27190-like leucine-rich repeats domain-containing protein n=1 Tax=Solanum lycopersicum TaxID=4081 RepID=A0A3Q7J5T8_SOLLC
MKTFVQEGISMNLESVNNDDLKKAMFTSKVFFPSLEELYINGANSISALWSHELPTPYLGKLVYLGVMSCGTLRNLMSQSVARGLLNLRRLHIKHCYSMEEVITKGKSIKTLFPLLEELNLKGLPKLKNFFLTEHALQFPFLREVKISECYKMKTFVQQEISVSRESDDEVFCPNLEKLYISGANSINALFSYQLPTSYFCKLEILQVENCSKLRNLMSQSVASGLLNLLRLDIENCYSMEEVIREEEQLGEGMITFFPLLKELNLQTLPKLGHFFLTEHALKFPLLRDMKIFDCHEMKTFVQWGISESTSSLQNVNSDDEVKVDDLSNAMFNSKVSCPNLKRLCIDGANNMSALFSYKLPIPYLSKLEILKVHNCEKLRNLMSRSVASDHLNLRRLDIEYCHSMEEVIREDEQQGEGIMTLFPMLEVLKLHTLPKLGHFFLTEHPLKFPFLKDVTIYHCSEMKTFVKQGISVSLESDDEVKVMFNSKVFCPNLEKLYMSGANSINALFSYQLPASYFSKLEILQVHFCGKLRNLMSQSVARGLLNLRRLEIKDCYSMKEVIREEEQQGEGIMTLFPLLEKLKLQRLPKLEHFFLTEQALQIPLLMEVEIYDCNEMKTFVQQGISVSTASLQEVNYEYVQEVLDLNKSGTKS